MQNKYIKQEDKFGVSAIKINYLWINSIFFHRRKQLSISNGMFVVWNTKY